MYTVLHVISGLHTGGAERMLHRVVSADGWSGWKHVVLSLEGAGEIGPRLGKDGIDVHRLGLVPPLALRCIPSLFRLVGLVRRIGPDLIQGWMYHGNIAASAGARMARTRVPVLWNVRHSLYGLKREKRWTRGLIKLGARFSPAAAAIIYNSKVSRTQHERLGFTPDRGVVVPNGFDCRVFAPDETAQGRLRTELGIDRRVRLVGMVARYHAMKDFPNFIRAAAAVADRERDICFLMAGRGVEPHNPGLSALVERHGLGSRLFLLGERTDVPFLMAGIDVLTVSSAWGEAFPNVVGEAMACGTPCVVTDVGDAGEVVGDTGLVVPPGDSEALARGWETLLGLSQEERRVLGRRARQRILDNYAIERVVRMYRDLYDRLLGACGREQATQTS